uniref:Reticulophagy regulator family member 2 n=1 Tax=Latimeria chalumnae TaxID=7897 RepID=H3AQ95_LATCH
RLASRLRQLLSRWESGLLALQRLLVWDRPAASILLAAAFNGLFWLFSSTSLRPIFLLSMSLIGIVLLERWKHKLLPDTTGPPPYSDYSDSESECETVHPRLLSLPELCHHLAESWVTCNLFHQELMQYKRQNPGKFCAKVCAGCFVLAVIGHYVPGIMISYIVFMSVLLWPLVVYHELIQKMYTGLEPILMKLDYSMKGETLHRKHEKKKKQVKELEAGDEPSAETESESESEAELACFSPTVDVKTAALALAITDSELSDEEASILESGGFCVSRATTPQLTDVSEDLDQQSVHSEPEENFSKDLPEFPSVEDYDSKDRGPQSEEDTFGVPSDPQLPEAEVPQADSDPADPSFFIQQLTSPLHFVNTHFNGQAMGQTPTTPPQNLGLSFEALSQEIVTTAISTVVQNTLSALLRSSEASEAPSMLEFLPTVSEEKLSSLQTQLTETVATVTEEEEGEEEGDDFELLDQTELEQMDCELGLSEQLSQVDQELPTSHASESSPSSHIQLPKP